MERETRTILLVDGTSSILFSHELLLRRLEYRVVTARSASEALDRIDSSMPSLVLTEVDLADTSGVELLRRIKKGPLQGLPVIMLTAERDPDVKQECTRLGCSAWLEKPVDAELLYRTLQRVCESVPRAYIRLKTSLRVMIGDGTAMGGGSRTENVTAISEGGMYVSTPYPQPRNALTPACIFLPGREIRVKAEVLYACGIGNGAFQEPGMGMKFVEIADFDREAIRTFIREQLAAGTVAERAGRTMRCPGAEREQKGMV